MRGFIFWGVLLCSAASLALAQNKPPSKKLYCWDEKGQRICSDALPAEAVTRARAEISASSGLRTAEVARALTDEEQAVEDAAKAQAQLDLAAQASRMRTEQAMLVSYPSEEALRRVFSERMGIVDNNIRTARYNVASLREGLISLLQTAGNQELAGQAVSPTVMESIRDRHAALVRQQQLQVGFEHQRTELNQEIAQTLERYRQIKQALPVADAPDTAIDNTPMTGNAPVIK